MKKTVLSLALLMLASAGFAKDKKNKEEEEVLYGIKSGIITMDMGGDMVDMFGDGSTMSTVIYFDDYGKKTATVTDFGTRRTRMINVDGEMLTVNDEEKTAQRMPAMMMGGRPMGGPSSGLPVVTAPSGKQVNFNNIDAKGLKKARLKDLGQEEIAGVMCNKYSQKTANYGMVTETIYWVYKGVVLQSQTESDFGSMGQQVKSIQENVEISPDIFELPEDYEVTEMNFGGMGGMMDFGGFGGGGMGGGFGGGGFGGGGF